MLVTAWRRVAAAVLVAVVASGCSAQAADQPTRSDAETGYVGATRSLTVIPPKDRKPAPEISGPELGTQQTISADEFSGKVIVLNVWGSWCGPCKAEAPDLQAASQQTTAVAQFIGLNTRDHDQGPPLAFNRTRGITYPSIFDPDGSLLVRFAGTLPATAIPSTIIIDTDGRMAARVVGPVTEQTLINIVEDVAGGR